MAVSLHNFLFGAYEPGGTLAIDKPPLDVWLQVISTQIVGFGPVALKLPPALCGTAAVPLLYDAVRRVLGQLAGPVGALMLAVLPIAVLSSRSDTMDASRCSSMCCAVADRALRADPPGALVYLAAASLGLAFNVKLFEGLSALPALALLGVLALDAPRARIALRERHRFVVVALSWLTVTLFFPGSERPYAIGSTERQRVERDVRLQRLRPRIWRCDAGAFERAGRCRAQPANNSEAARAASPIGFAGAAAPVRARRSPLGPTPRLRTARLGPAWRPRAGRPCSRPWTRPGTSARSRRACSLARDRLRPFQRDGAPAPTLRGGLHAGRGRERRDRSCLGDRRRTRSVATARPSPGVRGLRRLAARWLESSGGADAARGRGCLRCGLPTRLAGASAARRRGALRHRPRAAAASRRSDWSRTTSTTAAARAVMATARSTRSRATSPPIATARATSSPPPTRPRSAR